ncbi:MAG: hypothetical protein WDW36_003285 [Sanguina aurantia]
MPPLASRRKVEKWSWGQLPTPLTGIGGEVLLPALADDSTVSGTPDSAPVSTDPAKHAHAHHRPTRNQREAYDRWETEMLAQPYARMISGENARPRVLFDDYYSF